MYRNSLSHSLNIAVLVYLFIYSFVCLCMYFRSIETILFAPFWFRTNCSQKLFTMALNLGEVTRQVLTINFFMYATQSEFACPTNQHSKGPIKKKAHKPNTHLTNFSNIVFLPCLIIIQSCYFDYKINKLFASLCISCSVHLILTYYVRKGS